MSSKPSEIVKDGPRTKVCTPGCLHPQCVAFRREMRTKDVEMLRNRILEHLNTAANIGDKLRDRETLKAKREVRFYVAQLCEMARGRT